ncbi:MAG TPA: hypothetical protein VN740_05455 [Solirubrobacteraceae bacterium]|nr:hypothetical protein [Solirubrobacteraceae bacterium]
MAPGDTLYVDITISGTVPSSVGVTVGFGDGGSSGLLTAYQCTAVSSAPSALPNGQVGAAYSQPLSGVGGTAPYAFAYQGALPPGVTLSPAGLLSGTPTQGGPFAFQALITDNNGCFGAQSYSVTVQDAPAGGTGGTGSTGAGTSSSPCPPVPPISVGPTMIVFSAYAQVPLTITGGTPPYQVVTSGGAVVEHDTTDSPSGWSISVDQNTARSGGPAQVTVVTAIDSAGCSGIAKIYVIAQPPPVVPVRNGESVGVSKDGQVALPVTCAGQGDCTAQLVLYSATGCPPTPPISVGPQMVDLGEGGSAPLTITGGTPPYRVVTVGGLHVHVFRHPSADSGFAFSRDILNGGGGFTDEVTVTAIDSVGCTGSAKIRVTATPTPKSSVLRSITRTAVGYASMRHAPKVTVGAVLKPGRTGRHFVEFGAGSSLIPAGKRGVVRVKLSRSALALLRRRGHLSARITGTLQQNSAGTPFVATITLKLKGRR